MKKRLVSLLMATLVIAQTVPAFAADTYVPVASSSYTINEDEGTVTFGPNPTDASFLVEAVVDKNYTVEVPKVITLDKQDDGSTYEKDFTATVKGDIPGGATIKVTPASTVTMAQTGKTDLTATVTGDNIGDAAEKTVDYDDIKADPWGTFTGKVTCKM